MKKWALVSLIGLTISNPVLAQFSPDYDPYSNVLQASIASRIEPALDEVGSATPGDRVIATFNFRVADGAIIHGTVAFPTKGDPAYMIRPGDRLFRIESQKPFKACAVRYSIDGELPCLIDDNGDGKFDRIAKDFFDGAKPLPSPVIYERSSDVHLPASHAGLTRSLIYQGVTSDGLKLSYREFSDDIARPAFSEDISIPLGKSFPQQFAVKGLIVTAIEIGPMGLKYRIDSIRPDSGWQP